MSNLLPGYATKTFSEIYESVNDFIYDYNNLQIPKIITVQNCSTLYYLLFAKFGNSPIANYDITQFKYKLFSIIWQYGPTWEKRLEIQANLRALTEDDLLKGSKAIYNHAYNPETQPKTGDLDEINYINEQNSTNYKKSKMDAYTQLWNLLDTDVTTDFLNKFGKLFKKFASPGTLLYVEDVDDEA